MNFMLTVHMFEVINDEDYLLSLLPSVLPIKKLRLRKVGDLPKVTH